MTSLLSLSDTCKGPLQFHPPQISKGERYRDGEEPGGEAGAANSSCVAGVMADHRPALQTDPARSAAKETSVRHSADPAGFTSSPPGTRALHFRSDPSWWSLGTAPQASAAT